MGRRWGESFSPFRLPLLKHCNWLLGSQPTRTSTLPTKPPLLKTTPNPHSRVSSWIPTLPSLRADFYSAELPRGCEPSAEGSGSTAVRSWQRAPKANTGFGSEFRRLLPARAARSERAGPPGLGADSPRPSTACIGSGMLGETRPDPTPAHGSPPARRDAQPNPNLDPDPSGATRGIRSEPSPGTAGRDTREPLESLRWAGHAGQARLATPLPGPLAPQPLRPEF